jgi:hypothetical protein
MVKYEKFSFQFLVVESKVLKIISDSNQVMSKYENFFFQSVEAESKGFLRLI